MTNDSNNYFMSEIGSQTYNSRDSRCQQSVRSSALVARTLDLSATILSSLLSATHSPRLRSVKKILKAFSPVFLSVRHTRE